MPALRVWIALYCCAIPALECSPVYASEEVPSQSDVGTNGDSTLTLLHQLLDAQRSAIGDLAFTWSFEYERFTVPLASAEGTPPSPDAYRRTLEQRAADPLKNAQRDEHTFFRGRAICQPASARLLLDARHVQQWIGGADKYLATREQISFDGNAWWDVQTTTPGMTLPFVEFNSTVDPEVDWSPSGTIAAVPPQGGRVPHLTGASGYLFRPGHLSLPHGDTWGESVPVSEFLRVVQEDGHPLAVTTDGPHIRVQLTVAHPPERSGVLELVFNTEHLAAVERVTWRGDGPGGVQLRIADYLITHSEVRPGIWFPSEIVWGNWQNPLATRVRLSEVAVVEEPATADFQVTFPPGTHITDHRNERFYLASGNVWNEARRTREYAKRYLADFDATDEEASSKTRLLAILLICGILCVIAFLAVRLRRTSRRSQGIGVLLLALLGPPANASEVEPHSPLTWHENGWVFRCHPDGRALTVVQCGYRVTCLALAAFNRDCDPALLSRELRPTHQGVSLDHIVSVLEAFRLRVDVRKHVSWNALERGLPRSVFAIVAIPPHRIAGGHYVGAYRDSSGAVRILDPPFKVTRLQQRDADSFTDNELVAVFISALPQTHPSCTEQELECEREVHLQPVAGNWARRITKEIAVRNTSDIPMWLRKISPPCGCIRVLDQPGLLLPNETRNIKVIVVPSLWGGGHRSKTLGITVAGQFTSQVRLHGELAPASSRSRDTQLQHIRVPVPLDWEEDEFETTIPLATRSSKLLMADWTVTEGNAWCSVSNTGDGEIVAQVNMQRDSLQQVREGGTLRARVDSSVGRITLTAALATPERLMDAHVSRAENGRFSFSGELPSIAAPHKWRASLETHASDVSTVKWETLPDHRWKITGELSVVAVQPMPVRIRFSHPRWMDFVIPCVVIP
ncbi:hypothetical protein Mal4_38350 [Maioricimonas rarisocia]|uniref:Peptidase C39 domain-containing protein n=1 Tax=Maioricimonas rarisocia TaxID=2528026 RepID=A0A517ZAM2_9PLAN|nr:hypothetical protein [Maioricimonas rarisocia]QDU39490.1 hypothetical protein Mal4_38350 [Maioricimonas rarisocia]